MRAPLRGQVGFAVGTGRCGTHFLDAVLRREGAVASSHERNPLNETFHRYCQWYRLPVDHEGFLDAKAGEIAHDLEGHELSFEASAYLSLSISELHGRFGARFMLLVRSPERVVSSFFRKGLADGEPWYAEPFAQADPALALGYQACRSFHHFLARIAPMGEDFERWNRMTRVGKLAWFWNALNARALEQLDKLPDTHRRIVRLEDLDHDRYREVASFLGFEPRLDRRAYDRIAAMRPGSIDVPAAAGWTSLEVEEFEREVAPMAGRLGYEHRLRRPAADQRPARPRRGPRQLANRLLEGLRVRAIETLGGRV